MDVQNKKLLPKTQPIGNWVISADGVLTVLILVFSVLLIISRHVLYGQIGFMATIILYLKEILVCIFNLFCAWAGFKDFKTLDKDVKRKIITGFSALMTLVIIFSLLKITPIIVAIFPIIKSPLLILQNSYESMLRIKLFETIFGVLVTIAVEQFIEAHMLKIFP